MPTANDTPMRVRWARLRFQIIGPLLAALPGDDDSLWPRIEEAAAKTYRHPITGAPVRYAAKTIESWYYIARKETDPFEALARKVPKHAGTHPAVSARVAAEVAQQHADHPAWSYQLHFDNLRAAARLDQAIGALPAYPTLRRYMQSNGLFRVKKTRLGKNRNLPEGCPPLETRCYEVEHVNALWHYDFHGSSRQVILPTGERKTAELFGVLDDRSRVCCHLQWYLDENTEWLVHGLSQAFQKRRLPRSLYSDRGGSMRAAELLEGLERIGVLHGYTLPRSPEQNGKIEHFWTLIEGRLMPMLEGEPELTLDLLNRATQAWVEGEYHHKLHSEIRETPLERYIRGPDVARECPSSDELRRAFRTEITRTQRRSDGSVSVEGVRYEVPSPFRTLQTLKLRVARWDLSSVDLVDPRSGRRLAILLPVDKARNAQGARRPLEAPASHESGTPKPTGIAPLLRELMADYAANGRPPGFIAIPPSETPMDE